MAFEIIFHAYEYNEDKKDYNRSKSISYDKKIGDIFEEVSLEKLASVILTQLARRDVFVYDVEVFELVKKKISFKQNKSGITLKNKKFNLASESIVVQEIEAPLLEEKKEVPSPLNEHSKIIPMANEPSKIIPMALPIQQTNIAPIQFAPKEPKIKKPIKTMIFSPSDLKYLKGKPWRFTPNKKYEIYKEKMAPNGVGMIFTAIDDTNREVEVSDEFFINDTINLLNEDSEVLKEDVLNWSGSKGFDMPNLRGR